MSVAQQGEKYQHHKGGMYTVLAIAKHSESLEDMVIYQNNEDVEKIWARPRSMFEDQVERGGELVDRFTLVSS